MGNRQGDGMNDVVSFALVVGGMLSVLVMAAGWALMRGSKRNELSGAYLTAMRDYEAQWDETEAAMRGEQ